METNTDFGRMDDKECKACLAGLEGMKEGRLTPEWDAAIPDCATRLAGIWPHPSAGTIFRLLMVGASVEALVREDVDRGLLQDALAQFDKVMFELSGQLRRMQRSISESERAYAANQLQRLAARGQRRAPGTARDIADRQAKFAEIVRLSFEMMGKPVDAEAIAAECRQLTGREITTRAAKLNDLFESISATLESQQQAAAAAGAANQ